MCVVCVWGGGGGGGGGEQECCHVDSVTKTKPHHMKNCTSKLGQPTVAGSLKS